MIFEAQQPVIERERREASLLPSEAVAEAARKSAGEAVLQEQRVNYAEKAHELALREAKSKVDLELCDMLREDGLECLYSADTVCRLSLAVEQTLGEHEVELSDIRLTRDSLAEQLSNYVAGIGYNPMAFLSRMGLSDLHEPSEYDLYDARAEDSDDYEH